MGLKSFFGLRPSFNFRHGLCYPGDHFLFFSADKVPFNTFILMNGMGSPPFSDEMGLGESKKALQRHKRLRKSLIWAPSGNSSHDFLQKVRGYVGRFL